MTHGAFAQAGYEDIDPEQAEAIKNMGTPSALSQMMNELQALYVRKAYLESLLQQYEAADAGDFYTDKIVHMIVWRNAGRKKTAAWSRRRQQTQRAARRYTKRL